MVHGPFHYIRSTSDPGNFFDKTGKLVFHKGMVKEQQILIRNIQNLSVMQKNSTSTSWKGFGNFKIYI